MTKITILVCFVVVFAFISDLQGLPVEDRLQRNEEGYGQTGLGLGFRALANLERKLGHIGKGLSCTFCKIATGLIQAYFKLESTEDEIVNVLTKVCIDLKIEDVRVCKGIILEFKDEVLSVFDMAVITPSDVCGSILGPSCADPGDAYGPWNITIPKKKNTEKELVKRSIRSRKVCENENGFVHHFSRLFCRLSLPPIYCPIVI